MSRKAKFLSSRNGKPFGIIHMTPSRPDKRAFPPNGDVPVLLAVMVERNKYHPKTASRRKEDRKAIARCLNGVVRWQDVELPDEMERAA